MHIVKDQHLIEDWLIDNLFLTIINFIDQFSSNKKQDFTTDLDFDWLKIVRPINVCR